MENQNDGTMIAIFQSIVKYLKQHGVNPQLNMLDNECFKVIKAYIVKEKIDMQLVKPHNHHVNAAERLIAMVKNHIVAGFSSIHKVCPLQLWDNFLEQI